MEMLTFYLILGAVMFSMGVLGVLLRRDAIVVLMCIELMLNAVNLTFVALSTKFGTLDGQIYVFFVMSVAAAEVAVGLAIVLSIFRNFKSIDTGKVVTLRG